MLNNDKEDSGRLSTMSFVCRIAFVVIGKSLTMTRKLQEDREGWKHVNINILLGEVIDVRFLYVGFVAA